MIYFRVVELASSLQNGLYSLKNRSLKSSKALVQTQRQRGDGLTGLSIQPLSGEQRLPASHQLGQGDYSLMKPASTTVSQNTHGPLAQSELRLAAWCFSSCHISALQPAYSSRTTILILNEETCFLAICSDESQCRFVTLILEGVQREAVTSRQRRFGMLMSPPAWETCV